MDETINIKISGQAVYIAVKHFFADKGNEMFQEAINKAVANYFKYQVPDQISETLKNEVEKSAIVKTVKEEVEKTLLTSNYWYKTKLKKEIKEQLRDADIQISDKFKELIRLEVKKCLSSFFTDKLS